MINDSFYYWNYRGRAVVDNYINDHFLILNFDSQSK